ncbi:F-box protein [Tripterygium wilfordii]|uniref:F-box protein n=1 Tax=Tripterygium wilfordii TaxID=458696 RepID=A0A7J7DIG9_TRIWF|nr:F-box protein At3g07870-like [Tripterygium wilfordii]XP_038703255.1 F-box protein At3g07870-like [Tripterygium wilfordii]KAF5746137.1 F-box protein [Tripterygium wilfordii]
MESLPREVAVDILSRLPIASILQAKLVCRSWRNLAQDPLLLRMHFSGTADENPCLVLHSDHPIRNQLRTVQFSADDENIEIVRGIDLPMMPEFDVVGSCNGFLCFCDSFYKNSLYVYNPCINSHKELPESALYPNQDVILGFGFHPMTKEFKVIRIIYYSRSRPGIFARRRFSRQQSEVQILTLGCKSWRSLGQLPYNHLIQPSCQVLFLGKLHWVSEPHRDNRGTRIISFDLAEEQFQIVPTPESSSLDRSGFQLVVLGDCLSAAVWCLDGRLEIWVMKEYNVKESWIKDFNIDGSYVPRGLEQDVDISFADSKFYLNSPLIRVLCLLMNGQILLEYKCRALVSYDPIRRTFKDIPHQGLPDWFLTVHVGSSLDWNDTLIGW